MRGVWIISLVLLTQRGIAQQFSKEQTIIDLSQLRQAIETYNPALSKYNPNFQERSFALQDRLRSDSVDLLTYFQLVSQMCALSHEGHFSVGSWQDTVHNGFLLNRYKYLPLSVKIIANRMYVWTDYSTEGLLERGEEILSINRRSIGDILELIRDHLPTDGHIETYAHQTIEGGFAWMYYLFVDQSDQFHCQTLTQNGTERRVNLSALLRDQQVKNFEQCCKENALTPTEPEGFYELNYHENYAYLRLESFDRQYAESHEIKAHKLYKSLFKEFREKKVENLVIDLRGNTGGRTEFADEMVPYIRRPDARAPYLKKTVSWEGRVRTYKLPKRSKWAFQGHVYVLVDGRTYSTGSVLARYFNEWGNATIIGQETGTRYEGFVAGSKQLVRLNHSQIAISIPRYHIFFPPSQIQPTNDRGLLPHYSPQYTIVDLINGADLHMAQALELIAAAGIE